MRKLILIICLSIKAVSCKTSDLKSNIHQEIEKTIDTKKDSVSFNKINEDFDSLMILRPYSNIARIEEKLKLNLQKIKSTHIQERDDMILFVLFKNRNVVEFVGIDRSKYSFREDEVKIYSRKYNFKLERGNNGESKLFIISD